MIEKKIFESGQSIFDDMRSAKECLDDLEQVMKWLEETKYDAHEDPWRVFDYMDDKLKDLRDVMRKAYDLGHETGYKEGVKKVQDYLEDKLVVMPGVLRPTQRQEDNSWLIKTHWVKIQVISWQMMYLDGNNLILMMLPE